MEHLYRRVRLAPGRVTSASAVRCLAVTQTRWILSGQATARQLSSLLPYALHFGMVHDDQLPLAKFAHSWVAKFAGLPGWQQQPAARQDCDESDAIAKPTIDEQIMDTNVGALLWVTGGTI